MRLLIVAILSVVLLTACGESERNNRLLQRAERVIENHPDSALAILCDSIDTTSLRTDRSRALYALLLSQAYDKNYIDISSDSIIAPAVEYFADGNEPHYAMLTHYYHSKVLLNQNKLSDAIILCAKAENFAKELNDDFYLGLIYGTIGNAYHKTHNHKEDIKYSRLSYNHFSKINKQPHQKYAQFALAVAHNNNGDFDQSESIHKELIDSATISCDTAFLVEVLESYSHLLWNSMKNTESKQILNSVQNKYNHSLSAISLAHLSDIYAKENKQDSASHYLSLAKHKATNHKDSVAIIIADYNFSLIKKNYDKALKLQQEKIDNLNASTGEIWQQSVMTLQRDYFESQAKNDNLEIMNQRTQIWLICSTLIAILFIATIIIYAQRMRGKAQQERISRILSEHFQMQTLVTKAKNRINELEKQLIKESNKSQSLINELAIQQETLQLYAQQSKLREEADSAVETSEIVARFRKILTQNANPTNEDWDNLDNYINLQFPGFKSILYRLTKLNDNEYHVCLLIKCKFTPNEIANIINRSRHSMSPMRSRMYYKLFKVHGSTHDFDEFIVSI